MTQRIHYIRPDEDAPPVIEAREAKDIEGIDHKALGWGEHQIIVDVTIPYSGVTFRAPVTDLWECFVRIGMDAIHASLPLYSDA